MQLVLLVGLAGFFGTISRYLLGQMIFKAGSGTFPYSTLFVNLIGCLLIGLIYGLVEKGSMLSTQTRIVLASGFCGGFTTFSAFSAESFQMIREGFYTHFALYAGLSILLGIAATFAGFFLIRLTAI